MPDLAPIRRLVADGALDAELAALVWLLVEARTPVVVAGSPGGGRERMLEALAGLLAEGARTATVAPDDDFAWLPEAVELGWRRDRPAGPAEAHARRLSSFDGVLVVHGLGDGATEVDDAEVDDTEVHGTEIGRPGVGGTRARIVVRALSLGYGLLATMTGGGLDDVLGTLHDPAVGTDADERSRLGVVLALSDEAPGAADRPPFRVTAAHYVRPVALDTHGHVQRLPPAVLATWNPGRDRWDHFAWGVAPELAGRLGIRPVELEREQARRAAVLAGRDAAGA